MTNQSKIVMNGAEITAVLTRFAQEITTHYPDMNSLAIIGIHTGGAHLASRLVKVIENLTGNTPEFGLLDITLYRDDVGYHRDQPVVKSTSIPFKISGKTIILVDDVLYTGRTVRAALDALIDFGRPQAIRLAVLIDRGLREFPIRPDFTGKSITTRPSENVTLHLTEAGDSDDKVIIETGD